MRSLILGVTGCAGSHLSEYLFSQGHEVSGTKRKTSSLDNLTNILDSIKIFDINLGNKESIADILSKSRPDHIYYLVSARNSDSIDSIYKTNVSNTALFFETLLGLPYKPKIVMISSSAVYGLQKDAGPVKEGVALAPSNHYALSKVFQEEIAGYYAANHGMDIVITRPFNHPGPREKEGLVCADFAKQIVRIERGEQQPVLRVGRLDNIRDFTDVRDSVRAYALIAEKGKPGDIYNVCSGRGISIIDLLNILSSMSSVHIEVQSEDSRVRNHDVNVQIGDNRKIYEATGWRPEIGLEQTLRDTLDYYREIDK